MPRQGRRATPSQASKSLIRDPPPRAKGLRPVGNRGARSLPSLLPTSADVLRTVTWLACAPSTALHNRDNTDSAGRSSARGSRRLGLSGRDASSVLGVDATSICIELEAAGCWPSIALHFNESVAEGALVRLDVDDIVPDLHRRGFAGRGCGGSKRKMLKALQHHLRARRHLAGVRDDLVGHAPVVVVQVLPPVSLVDQLAGSGVEVFVPPSLL
mmetsp:Transcript_12694/g.39360  ORF Transcript_12694/g.39360 Transcript_12694/m.39360 type:complete len:214 (-) Transcript_12694:34-675(-)